MRYLLGQGIRQFIDLGSGLPTQGNVHQICEEMAPGQANVIYVDHDRVADNYKQTTAQMNLRTHGEVAEFFGGWPLVDPGLVWIVDWMPEGHGRGTAMRSRPATARLPRHRHRTPREHGRVGRFVRGHGGISCDRDLTSADYVERPRYGARRVRRA